MSKKCTRCGKSKPLARFQRDAQKKDGRRSECKTCAAKAKKLRYRKDPSKSRESNWKRQGIDMTWERYQQMLAERKGKCDICKRSGFKQALAVDHNHKTGQVRGLLCSYCNHRVLRHLHDCPERAAGVVDYLIRWFELIEL